MAMIKIEVDTEAGIREGAQMPHRSTENVAARPIMVVSTIKLTQELRDAFERGAGQSARYFGDTDYDDLINKISHVDGPDRFIVTAGGLIAFAAAKEAALISKFVSLVGTEPTGNVGNCYGGVTLKSFTS
jgi:hypothetical protein